MSGLVVDLFAGPGGWDEGARLAGYTGELVGFDNSLDACRTAMAAGHARVAVDLTSYPPNGFTGRVDGVVASPTCRPWSVANTSRTGLDDPRGQLIRIPLRWVLALRPRWAAWEITPIALPVFEQQAEVLRRAGYNVWIGKVRAEQFGVPSSRTRASLVARLDGTPNTPAPTHPRPVTMGEALRIVDDGRELVSNYGTNGDPNNRGRRHLGQLAPTMTGKCGRNRWVWPHGFPSPRNLTVAEAGVLNGFPIDYPWQGGSISRQQQVGDAVPPPLAAAILRPLLVHLATRIERVA